MSIEIKRIPGTKIRIGMCICGEEFQVEDQYLGACECPNCGKWYNLFGQELKNPSTWPQGDDW